MEVAMEHCPAVYDYVDQTLLRASFWILVGGLVLGFILSLCFNFYEPDPPASQDDAPKYWNPAGYRFVYSTTPLLFPPHAGFYEKNDDAQDNCEIQYVYKSEMVRISTKLSCLLRYYSSYFYHLYATYREVVLIQNRIFQDFQDRFPPTHVRGVLEYLINRDTRLITREMQALVQFLGIPELVGIFTHRIPMLYQDWVEEQSEAWYYLKIYCKDHPLFARDPLFDYRNLKQTVVCYSVHNPYPVVASAGLDLQRLQDRSAVYFPCATSSSSSSSSTTSSVVWNNIQDEKDLFAIKNDFLAHGLVRHNGGNNQYCFLARAQTAWKTKSQFLRDVPIHTVWLMQHYGLTIFLHKSLAATAATNTTSQNFATLQDLIHYHALNFLLASTNRKEQQGSDKKKEEEAFLTLKHQWTLLQQQQQQHHHQEDRFASAVTTVCEMPPTWLGPPVSFSLFCRSSSSASSSSSSCSAGR